MSCISCFAVLFLVWSALPPTPPQLSEATQPSASFVQGTHSSPLPHEHHYTTLRLPAPSTHHLGGGGRGRMGRKRKDGEELKELNRCVTHVW